METIEALTLRCSTCQEWKPDDAFNVCRAKVNRRGRSNRCKSCRKVHYRNDDRDKHLERARTFRIENPELARQRDRSYVAANRTRILERRTVIRADNPQRQLAENYVGDGGYGQIFAIWAKEVRRLRASPCAVCGKRGDIHADHVIPKSRGGNHGIGNLQPLCGRCNRSKGDRLMSEWKYKA